MINIYNFESEQDRYFREKLKKLSITDCKELMVKYIVKAVSYGSIDMNEFDREIDELLSKEK